MVAYVGTCTGFPVHISLILFWNEEVLIKAFRCVCSSQVYPGALLCQVHVCAPFNGVDKMVATLTKRSTKEQKQGFIVLLWRRKDLNLK